jgi:hypothetical protein
MTKDLSSAICSNGACGAKNDLIEYMVKAKQDSQIQKGEQMFYNHYSRNKAGSQSKGGVEEPQPTDIYNRSQRVGQQQPKVH